MLSDPSGDTITVFFCFSYLFPNTVETQKFGHSVYLVYFVILKVGKKIVPEILL